MSEPNPIASHVMRALWGLAQESGRRAAANSGATGGLEDWLQRTTESAVMSVLVDYFTGKFNPLATGKQWKEGEPGHGGGNAGDKIVVSVGKVGARFFPSEDGDAD